MVIATQMFGLKAEFAADLTVTIQALHDAGFQAIEPARSRSIRVSWRNI